MSYKLAIKTLETNGNIFYNIANLLYKLTNISAC